MIAWKAAAIKLPLETLDIQVDFMALS